MLEVLALPYKVLLVDDEVIDLQWLNQSILWKKLNLEVVATVNSPFKALTIIENEEIDFVITDISMPIMSGLEMAKKAKEIRPNLKILFISGHEEFDYVKQAITQGAFGYILKPIDMNELQIILSSLSQQLQKEHQDKNERIQFHKHVSIVKNEVIYHWLQGKNEELAIELLNESGFSFGDKIGIVGIIEIDDLKYKIRNNMLPNDEEQVLQIMKIIANNIKDWNVPFYYMNDNYDVTIIINDFYKDKIEKKLNKMIELIKEETTQTITVGLGNSAKTYEELIKSFRTASQLINYKMYLGKCRVITSKDKDQTIEKRKIDFDFQMNELISSIVENKKQQFEQLICEMYNIDFTMSMRTEVYNFTLILLFKLDELLRTTKQVNMFEIMNWDYKYLNLIYGMETITDIQKWVIKLCMDLSSAINKINQNHERKIVDDIKTYVKKKLNEKLTLKDVADHFGFSPNHLGFVFKKDTGENFSDFLVNERLERACQYLLDPKMKVYEIAEMMEYKNIIHFNRQFKKHYGINPSQYRQNHKV